MKDILIDQATDIRKGEELNLGALEAYLLKHLPGNSGPLQVEQFPGGASNLTYLLRLGDHQLVLRRPPFGADIKSAHDMGREFKVLSALSKHYRKAPSPLLYCDDLTIIGAPFYLMQRVEGVILRTASGPAKELGPEIIAKIADSLIGTMVELHGLNYEDIGLGQLGKPEGYAERQITGWTKRYFKAKTDEWPELEKSAQWLSERIPAETDASLIHNDFKHDNVILDAADLTRIIAILDWEMCTLGDPLMDVGTSLAYWVNHNDPDFLKMAIKYPCSLPGNPSRGEFLQIYAQKSGRDVSDFVFYYVYGLFKIAVILQQIYYRYQQGFTQDPRFAKMQYGVSSLGKMALRAIEKQRIDDLY